MKKKLEAFERLLKIMDNLRVQCPWDRKQTLKSLSSLTIEETYELVDAIHRNNLDEVKEETGDLLLHMVFYAKIASEKNHWDIGDALNTVCDKLIRRHPHIYGDVQVKDDIEVKKNWEKIKMSEGKKSVLEGVPKALPPLIKAQRMQEKAAQVGFEWEKTDDVWEKVKEEMGEFEEARLAGKSMEMEEEFGDILFALINYARFQGIDASFALEKTNTKFRSRVEYIEKHTDKPLTDMTLEEMDELWNEAKKKSIQNSC